MSLTLDDVVLMIIIMDVPMELGTRILHESVSHG